MFLSNLMQITSILFFSQKHWNLLRNTFFVYFFSTPEERERSILKEVFRKNEKMFEMAPQGLTRMSLEILREF